MSEKAFLSLTLKNWSIRECLAADKHFKYIVAPWLFLNYWNPNTTCFVCDKPNLLSVIMLEIMLEAFVIWLHLALTIIVRTCFLHACLGRDLYNFLPRTYTIILLPEVCQNQLFLAWFIKLKNIYYPKRKKNKEKQQKRNSVLYTAFTKSEVQGSQAWVCFTSVNAAVMDEVPKQQPFIGAMCYGKDCRCTTVVATL